MSTQHLKIKILISVLVIIVILIGGWLIWSNQIYSETQRVIVSTDKTEYALGEKAKIIVRNNLEKPIWYVDYVCPPWWKLEFQENGAWKLIKDFSPETLRYCKEGEKFCKEGYITEYNYCPPEKPIQDVVKKIEPNFEIFKIWSLINRKYPRGTHDSYALENMPPGTYRFSFTYGFTQNSYDTDLFYSNEFLVKKGLWRKIADVCKEEKEDIDSVRSSPPCREGEKFMGVDGWTVTWYYDKRKTGTAEFPETRPSEAPKELQDATIAKFSQSLSCESPISYEILVGDKFEEVTCEKFYKFLQDYESSCGGCILTWSFECC
jgi:hypothetical protein